eukprot:Phypoly_transcript_06223.p1 GENE.Phypoly_transcript_06223~~Phypoly_transcript_06223.p1  ORF type:complete len:578 (+),score=136.11 Phypoly_transcript_06223:34-1734(+)
MKSVFQDDKKGVACEPCRKSHVKCDRVKPACGVCTRRGIQNRCYGAKSAANPNNVAFVSHALDAQSSATPIYHSTVPLPSQLHGMHAMPNVDNPLAAYSQSNYPQSGAYSSFPTSYQQVSSPPLSPHASHSPHPLSPHLSSSHPSSPHNSPHPSSPHASHPMSPHATSTITLSPQAYAQLTSPRGYAPQPSFPTSPHAYAQMPNPFPQQTQPTTPTQQQQHPDPFPYATSSSAIPHSPSAHFTPTSPFSHPTSIYTTSSVYSPPLHLYPSTPNSQQSGEYTTVYTTSPSTPTSASLRSSGGIEAEPRAPHTPTHAPHPHTFSAGSGMQFTYSNTTTMRESPSSSGSYSQQLHSPLSINAPSVMHFSGEYVNPSPSHDGTSMMYDSGEGIGAPTAPTTLTYTNDPTFATPLTYAGYQKASYVLSNSQQPQTSHPTTPPSDIHMINPSSPTYARALQLQAMHQQGYTSPGTALPPLSPLSPPQTYTNSGEFVDKRMWYKMEGQGHVENDITKSSYIDTSFATNKSPYAVTAVQQLPQQMAQPQQQQQQAQQPQQPVVQLTLPAKFRRT